MVGRLFRASMQYQRNICFGIIRVNDKPLLFYNKKTLLKKNL